MKSISSLIILFTLLAFSSTYAVESNQWVVNKDHSELLFKIPYLNISEISGRFSKFKGHVNFDSSDNIKDIKFTIQTSSIYTGNDMRDNHLKSHEFLHTKKYPTMTFTGQDIVKGKDGKSQAVGLLTIKTIKKSVPVNFEITKPIEDTWGNTSKFIKYTAKINRKEFGIVWDKSIKDNKYLVGDIITISGLLQLQKKNAVTTSSRHMIPDTNFIRKRDRMNRGEEVALNITSAQKEIEAAENAELPPLIKPTKKFTNAKDLASTSEYFSPLNVALTVITGFILFIITIAVGLIGQKYLTDLFLKLGANDTVSFLVPSMIILLILIVISIYTAPYMGWGVNPLL